MNEEIKTRVEKAKSYVTTHAPQVVTATAAVVGVVLMRAQLKETRFLASDAKELANGRHHSASVIHACVNENRKYEYHPGIGVYVYPDGHQLIQRDN